MRKAIGWLIILALAGGAAWWTTRPAPVEVELHTLAPGPVEETVANTRAGTLKACRRAHLSLLTGGTVAHLYVEKGERVEQGERLLELWNEDRKAQVEQAAARRDRLRKEASQACTRADRDARELKRQQALASKGLSSEDTLDRLAVQSRISQLTCEAARIGVRESEATVALQDALLEQTRLTAPFSGIVAEINGEVGEYVTPSPPGVATPPAVDLYDDACLYVSAPVDEVDIGRVKLNAPVRITLDAWRDRSLSGRVTRIAPFVQDREKQARTLEVDVRFDSLPQDLLLRPGLSADTEIRVARRENVLRVPTDLILDGRAVYVYDASSGTIARHTFTPGLSNWSWTEVVSGLSAGDQIVRNLDAEGLDDGVSVTPRTH